MYSPFFKRSILNTLGVVTYVALVALFMNNANAWLGKEDTILTGIVFLLLLSVSAATVGSLVFGYPIFLFLDGKKREALQAIIMTIGLLLVETIVAIGVVSIIQ
jgi:hypothetical protein